MAEAPHRLWLVPIALLLAALLFSLTSLAPATPTAEGQIAAADEPPSWLLPLDDAYIFIRFAQQVARGRSLRWADELSSGATSPAYLALVLPGQWLTDGLPGWSRWSWWVGLVTLWGLGLACARLFRAFGAPRPWPLVAGLAAYYPARQAAAMDVVEATRSERVTLKPAGTRRPEVRRTSQVRRAWLWTIAWRSLEQGRTRTVLSALAVALGAAMTVATARVGRTSQRTSQPSSVTEVNAERSGPSISTEVVDEAAPGWRWASGYTRFGMPRNSPAERDAAE